MDHQSHLCWDLKLEYLQTASEGNRHQHTQYKASVLKAFLTLPLVETVLTLADNSISADSANTPCSDFKLIFTMLWSNIVCSWNWVNLMPLQKHIIMCTRGDSQALQFWVLVSYLYFWVIFCTIWYSGCFQKQVFFVAFQLKGAVQSICMLGVKQRQEEANRFVLCNCAVWMLFNEIMARDSFPTEMWNFFCGRRSLFTVYSQCALFTISPQIWLFANKIPKLDTSQLKMQLSYTLPKADGFGIVKIVCSTDTIYCWLKWCCLTVCASCIILWTQLCGLCQIKWNIERRNNGGTVKL